MTQIVEADKLVWHKLIEDNESASGTLALDTALASALKSYHTSFALLSLPRTGERKGGKSAQDEGSSPNKGSGIVCSGCALPYIREDINAKNAKKCKQCKKCKNNAK